MISASFDSSEPAAARAYNALEGMVVTLVLAPGSFVTESALIDRLGLGRTPVREAVQRLSWEGLLEVRPRAGITVAPLHGGDWLRVVDARRGIEKVLARSAARFVTREATARLHGAALAMQKAVMASDVVAFLAADKAMNAALAASADNMFAAHAAAPLQTHCRRFWFRYRAQVGMADCAAHHVALIQSVLDGDENAAAANADGLMDFLRGMAEDAATR
ncbi:GntR family transcriptional regulator [Aquamicrobium ahrensii]|uniref:DNA-binding GntR family transcriptional regulator n=1 Tax=Aquamicrobium ahrensii TaxID=469551 RepID=A0ABV2KN29_9HYPH